MAAPMDLNVPLCENSVLLQKIQMAAKLGYSTVAINNIQPDLLVKPKKEKDSKGRPQGLEKRLQAAESIKIDEKLLSATQGGKSKMPRQISRISTVLADLTQSMILNHEIVQGYDLIAVTPTDDKTFHKACTELNIDIITIDLTQKLGYKIKRPTLNAAMERGIHFELQYSAALRDETCRRYFISNAQNLVFWCKGKNVILTSGCEKPFEQRGPHDVANLGLLIDLKDAQAKDTVTNNCRAALCHSESRRIIKSVMKVDDSSLLPDKERDWIVNKCSVEVKGERKSMDVANGELEGKRKPVDMANSELEGKRKPVDVANSELEGKRKPVDLANGEPEVKKTKIS